jgi:hypothetical protein
MSFGANFASTPIDTMAQTVINCNMARNLGRYHQPKCCSTYSGPQPVASYPSVILKPNCNNPTPAEFALYPKVAIPSSVRTMVIKSCYDSTPIPTNRFAMYNRYTVPVPCAPLPASANMAGISKPSVRECNIYPNT